MKFAAREVVKNKTCLIYVYIIYDIKARLTVEGQQVKLYIHLPRNFPGRLSVIYIVTINGITVLSCLPLPTIMQPLFKKSQLKGKSLRNFDASNHYIIRLLSTLKSIYARFNKLM